jgi:hypothetical protein
LVGRVIGSTPISSTKEGGIEVEVKVEVKVEEDVKVMMVVGVECFCIQILTSSHPHINK